MSTYDIIIIGAGHNGLVCAAYLLNAGYRVALLEKRAIPGGAATTEELMPQDAPGFHFNRCAIDHEFIHLGPVVEELNLSAYGLDYLFCDPTVFCPHPDGKYFLSHRSLDKTCAEIAQFNRRDAEKYREFIDFWQRLTKAITPIFNAPPQAIIDILGNYDLTSLRNLLSVLGGPHETLDLIRTMLSSPKNILEEYFDSEFIKAPLARLASEFGAPPSQKTISVGGMMMSMRHNPGMARPRGGTGALVEALVRLVTSKGGTILTEQMVERILIDNDGKAAGVRTASGQEYRATLGVISNIDARRVFLQMIDPSDLNSTTQELKTRLKRRTVNNNETILRIDCALSEVPRFEAYQHRDDYLVGSVLIADSLRHVEIAHYEPSIGNIPDANPSFYAVVPTVRDRSMAPDGRHTLWIEFFAPYQIAGATDGLAGTGWTDSLKNAVADRVIDKLADYAPNIKSAIIARNVESPAELGQRLGAYKGNYYHLDMTLDQMVFFRPLPEIANYTTPIEGLYLTGAGTHPGGAISGIPGRNCARTFLNAQRPVLHRLEELRKTLLP